MCEWNRNRNSFRSEFIYGAKREKNVVNENFNFVCWIGIGQNESNVVGVAEHFCQFLKQSIQISGRNRFSPSQSRLSCRQFAFSSQLLWIFWFFCVFYNCSVFAFPSSPYRVRVRVCVCVSLPSSIVYIHVKLHGSQLREMKMNCVLWLLRMLLFIFSLCPCFYHSFVCCFIFCLVFDLFCVCGAMLKKL